MKPGTILFDARFKFHDGAVGEKLLLVLSNGESGIYVIAKTTSKQGYYGTRYGCQTGTRYPCFFLPRGCSCFPLDTWVCLDEFYEFNRAKVLERHFRDPTFKRQGELSDAITLEVLKCVIGDSQDVSGSQLEMIKASLTAMELAAQQVADPSVSVDTTRAKIIGSDPTSPN